MYRKSKCCLVSTSWQSPLLALHNIVYMHAWCICGCTEIFGHVKCMPRWYVCDDSMYVWSVLWQWTR